MPIPEELDKSCDALEKYLSKAVKPVEVRELFSALRRQGVDVSEIYLREGLWYLLGRGVLELTWDRKWVHTSPVVHCLRLGLLNEGEPNTFCGRYVEAEHSHLLSVLEKETTCEDCLAWIEAIKSTESPRMLTYATSMNVVQSEWTFPGAPTHLYGWTLVGGTSVAKCGVAVPESRFVHNPTCSVCRERMKSEGMDDEAVGPPASKHLLTVSWPEWVVCYDVAYCGHQFPSLDESVDGTLSLEATTCKDCYAKAVSHVHAVSGVFGRGRSVETVCGIFTSEVDSIKGKSMENPVVTCPYCATNIRNIAPKEVVHLNLLTVKGDISKGVINCCGKDNEVGTFFLSQVTCVNCLTRFKGMSHFKCDDIGNTVCGVSLPLQPTDLQLVDTQDELTCGYCELGMASNRSA